MALRFSSLIVLALTASSLFAQGDETLYEQAKSYFSRYAVAGYRPSSAMRLDSVVTDSAHRQVRFYANEAFCAQTFTEERVQGIYAALKELMGDDYRRFVPLVMDAKGREIGYLVPNAYRTGRKDSERTWQRADYSGQPWVANASRPFEISLGLARRHLCLWHSHGRYYRSSTGQWEWQRPYLFCTTEDLFTQSIVLPYLLPMLENAGAVVVTPRERDRQREEVVVDNDDAADARAYQETALGRSYWSTTPTAGFGMPYLPMTNSSAPFSMGTARMVETTTAEKHLATASWYARVPATGDYAVYVSYQTMANSTDEAHYTVHHAGGATEFVVNQRMGGGTWVYLGTFRFLAGAAQQRVVLSNLSRHGGVVVADGVRFGGGMGQTERGGQTSGLPRFLEAARYNAQWSGMPDSLWNKDAGANDYNDDLRSRGNYLNWLAGMSDYVPTRAGKGVPIELSLAVHSDAGTQADLSVHGSLAIYTQRDGEGSVVFPEGMARQASGDFGALVLDGLRKDLSAAFGISWTQRELWNRNYAETRIPDVPSIILETLSHQNFADMRMGHDPIFKFTLARSVYKSLLRYLYSAHGEKRYAVQPLPVRQFAALLTADGVQLSWQPQTDSTEPTATPHAYVVYTRQGDGGFDNGVVVQGTSVTLPLQAGIPYGFKVTAINKGGESFPSEILSAYRAAKTAKEVLIVNGFDRLSGPAWVQTADSLGFDLEADYGVPYLYTTAFAGRQLNFDPSGRGREGISALGYSDSELEGQELAGNTFDYPALHGNAIARAGYSYSSVSREALTAGGIQLSRFAAMDYIAGFQRRAPYNLRPFAAFPAEVQTVLRAYAAQGGRLLVSGSYIGSDLRTASDSTFAAEVLKYRSGGTLRGEASDTIRGGGYRFTLYRTPCAEQLAAVHPDVLLPVGTAFSSLAYSNGHGAGIAYRGAVSRVIALGFPFESIREERIRQQAMQAFLHFLTQ